MNLDEISKSLQFLTKLMNTKPEIFIQFFIDVGFDVIKKTDQKLLDYLSKSLKDFQSKIDPENCDLL